MRHNLPVAAVPYERAAAALGLGSADGLIGRVESLTRELGLPTRLRDLGVERSSLGGAVVDHVLRDGGAAANIAPVDAAAVGRLLAAAW